MYSMAEHTALWRMRFMCQQPMQMKSFAARKIMCPKSSQGMLLLKVNGSFFIWLS